MTVAAFLVALDSRWMRVVAPLLGILLVALVAAHYHVPVDIAGGAGVGAAVFAAAWRGSDAWRARRARPPVRP